MDKKRERSAGEEEEGEENKTIEIDWKLSRRNQLTVELMETTCVAGASVRIESVMVSALLAAAARPGAGGGADIVLGERRRRNDGSKEKQSD